MKTHIIFATLALLFLTACASHEGRTVASSPEEKQEETKQFSRAEANWAREVGARN